MAWNIEKMLADMAQMNAKALQEKFAELFGCQPHSRNKQWLIKRIVWRMQALAEGDLSERARRRAEELANDADLRLTAPRSPKDAPDGKDRTATLPARFSGPARLPPPGTLLTRCYKGRLIQVKVLPKGFEYEGQVYQSLTAVARAITGARWNGYHFFGLAKRGGAP